jgi:hypothetical protein
VSRESVPRALPDAIWTGPVHQIAPGRVLVAIPRLARALVHSSGHVAFDPEPGANPEDVGWFLDRPVREAAELMAGRLALRAAAVVIDGHAVALAGQAASGKSTIAATLAQRGHGVLTDHHLTVETGAESLVAHAAGGQLDLWPEAVETLGLAPGRGTVIRPALTKRAYAFSPAGAAPVRLLIVLARIADVGAARSDSLSGGEALEALHEASIGRMLLEPLQLRSAHFRWIVAIARGARIAMLRIDRHRNDPHAVADKILELVT